MSARYCQSSSNVRMNHKSLLTLFIISYLLISDRFPFSLSTSGFGDKKTIFSLNKGKSSSPHFQRASRQLMKSLTTESGKCVDTGYNGNSVTKAEYLQETDSYRNRIAYTVNRSGPAFKKRINLTSSRKHIKLLPKGRKLNTREQSDLWSIHRSGERRATIPFDTTPHQQTERSDSRSGFRVARFLSDLKSTLKKHLNKASRWRISAKEAKEMFDKYYRCLRARVTELKAEEFPIKALMTVEGDRLALPCGVCYRPDRDRKSQEARWQVLLHDTSAMLELIPGSRVKITKNNTLILKDISVADAGQYFCLDHEDYAAIYQVDVFLTDRRRQLKFPTQPARPEKILLKRNLRVLTVWAPWTECNTCDRPGQKHRVGQCMVKKVYPDMPIFPRDYPLMVLYPEGVPCHSTALPRHLRRLQDIGRRYSETLVSPCMEACPTQPPVRTVTDEDGKVVEVLEPGFYSMKSKPTLPPLIKRKVLYEPEKSHLVLKCPIHEEETSLIRWLRGKRQVDPSTIRRQTQGRVWVDSLSRLHLKPLLLSDTAVYK